jgi:hypothetical protein
MGRAAQVQQQGDRVSPGQVFNKHYLGAYDAAWSAYFNGQITADEAIDRCDSAARRAAKQVKRQTGYTIPHYETPPQ